MDMGLPAAQTGRPSQHSPPSAPLGRLGPTSKQERRSGTPRPRPPRSPLPWAGRARQAEVPVVELPAPSVRAHAPRPPRQVGARQARVVELPAPIGARIRVRTCRQAEPAVNVR